MVMRYGSRSRTPARAPESPGPAPGRERREPRAARSEDRLVQTAAWTALQSAVALVARTHSRRDNIFPFVQSAVWTIWRYAPLRALTATENYTHQGGPGLAYTHAPPAPHVPTRVLGTYCILLYLYLSRLHRPCSNNCNLLIHLHFRDPLPIHTSDPPPIPSNPTLVQFWSNSGPPSDNAYSHCERPPP
jgi:hypothetical protein